MGELSDDVATLRNSAGEPERVHVCAGELEEIVYGDLQRAVGRAWLQEIVVQLGLTRRERDGGADAGLRPPVGTAGVDRARVEGECLAGSQLGERQVAA